MSQSINDYAPIHEPMLIGGERVDGDARIAVHNPARPNELVGTVVRGTPAHVNDAVAQAKAAQPAWAKLSFVERARVLQQALNLIEDGVDERAVLFTRENGKPLAEARGELAGVPKRQKLALGYAEQLDQAKKLTGPNLETRVFYRPYGVVASIVPWNSPTSLAFTQIVAALLAGNCVVLKPPESCPLTLIRTAAKFAQALPAGALNIVTGLPSEIGDALTTHPDIGKIGFTGSIPSARHIMANAAQTIKGVTLELGGNDPAILLEDADLGPAAIKTMLGATFQMTGQVCMAIKRIYAPTSRAAEFVQAFSQAVDSLVVGDGLEPQVTLGPLHTHKARERAQNLLDDAVSRGAKAKQLGKVHDASTFKSGYFVRPTIVTEAPDDAPLMTEEQFCPIIPVSTYDALGDAIARANDTIFGLSASVWGKDGSRAIDVARQLEAGQVWINAHGPGAINHQAPYGGVKQSGIGRKSGLEGILEYLQSQTITAHGAS
jgi:acyl-CoA reductase-like NAD-dependent aldehyde dehydrogenase